MRWLKLSTTEGMSSKLLSTRKMKDTTNY